MKGFEAENKNFCCFLLDFSFFAVFLEQFCIVNFFIQYSKILSNHYMLFMLFRVSCVKIKAFYFDIGH
jgi:hypothetical protein